MSESPKRSCEDGTSPGSPCLVRSSEAQQVLEQNLEDSTPVFIQVWVLHTTLLPRYHPANLAPLLRKEASGVHGEAEIGCF